MPARSQSMQDRPVVVLAVDFSPASERALDAAVRAAKEWGARIAMVHVTTPLGAPGLDLAHPAFDAVRNESADVAGSAQPGLAQAWRARIEKAGVPAEIVILAGPAAQAICDEARRLRAKTIVVGTHGRTGLERTALGSVARDVLARSHVPVLVVPGRAAAA